MLYCAHDYLEAYHMRPPNFNELFEFLRRRKVNGILKDYAIATMKAKQAGNG